MDILKTAVSAAPYQYLKYDPKLGPFFYEMKSALISEGTIFFYIYKNLMKTVSMEESALHILISLL